MRNLISKTLFCFFAILYAWIGIAHAETGNEPNRIIAIGDLHGDYEVWRAVARQAGLINRRGRWTGGDTVLVQLGDVTDRGPNSLRIIRHLQELQERAPKKGGNVIVLLGNHEAMNIIGDLRYVDPGEYTAFKSKRSERIREAVWQANEQRIVEAYASLIPPVAPEEAKQLWFQETPLGMLEHRMAWRPGGELAQWAATLPAIVQFGEVLFVHGGLSAENAVGPLEDLNSQYSAALLPGPQVDRSAVEDPLGLLWYRGNIRREAIKPPQDQAELSGENVQDSIDSGSVAEEQPPTPAVPQRLPPDEELTEVLARYGATRLIVGHTPSIEGIVTARDNRLIRIDTGMSSFYGGPASYLEIIDDRFIAHQRDGEGTWHARELPKPLASPVP